MKNKDSSITFNVEEEYKFYMERLEGNLYTSNRVKGKQMRKYLETSILFNPVDIEYTKEELQEKLQKTKEIKKLIESMLEEN